MNFLGKTLMTSVVFSFVVGCSTTGTFKIPEGTDLYISDLPAAVEVKANGNVTTRPYAWRSIGIPPDGGIPYRLEKDGEVVKEGKLRSVFRGVSIIWPPFAAIYWPVGLNPYITYDLVNDKQQ